MSTEPNQIKWRGIRLAAGETSLPVSLVTTYYTVEENLTAGEDFAAGDVGYISAAGTVKKANASAEATALAMCIATEAISSGSTGDFHLLGCLTIDTYNFTPGSILWLNTTSGEMTHTPPGGANQVAIRLGWAVTATKVFFNPDKFYRVL